MAEEPVNYTDLFQEEIRAQQSVDVAARKQRLEIEEQLKTDPFYEHLYTEQQFEKLIFFEQRRTNELLTQIVNLLSGSHSGIEKPVSGVAPIQLSTRMKSEDLVEMREAPVKQEPIDPETGIHQIESDGLSEPERATLAADTAPPKPPVGRPAAKGRR